MGVCGVQECKVLNECSVVHIFLRPSFLLAWSSFSPGPWLVHVKFLLAVGYLIVGPGFPLLQVIARCEISLARVYLSLLGLYSAQRARKSLGLGSFLLLFFLARGWIELNYRILEVM